MIFFRCIARLELLRAAGFFVCFFMGYAVADVVDFNSIPDALKGINPAIKYCRRDNIGDQHILSSNLPDDKPDVSCASTIDKVRTLIGRPDVILLDLRAKSEFAAFHVDGALNLDFGELRSKPYWRSKTVVLLGNGKAESQLYAACADMKRKGYKQVRVLRGGMIQWLENSMPVVGHPFLPGKMAQLTPVELWQEGQNQYNLVILDHAMRNLQKDLPFSIVVPQISLDAIKMAIDKRRKQLKGTPLIGMIIAASQEVVSDDKIFQLRQAMAPMQILTYRGTMDSFFVQIKMQRAVWVAHDKGPKQIGCGL